MINLKLERQEYTGMLEEARAIQESLLPMSPPSFAGYDIAATSRAAQIVGGAVTPHPYFGGAGSAWN